MNAVTRSILYVSSNCTYLLDIHFTTARKNWPSMFSKLLSYQNKILADPTGRQKDISGTRNHNIQRIYGSQLHIHGKVVSAENTIKRKIMIA